MKNPYEHDWLDDEVRIGRTEQRIALALFLVLLVFPALTLLLPGLRPDTPLPKGRNLADRLAAWEKSAKTLPLFERWRRGDQARVTARLQAGNAKVFVGGEGWLYYRPDLEAVTGKGPWHLEPPSVARERSSNTWQPPLPVIEDFAAQLARRNIRLVLVPVPTKAMVCREGLGLEPGVSPPPSWTPLANQLAAAGIGFVDLLPVIEARGPDSGRFLKQDTHWTPGTMEAAAKEVARVLSPDAAPSTYGTETLARSSTGDLTGMLDTGGRGHPLFPPETADLRRVVPPASGGVPGPGGKIVLLGDSFVNVFEDPSLGFAETGEATIGAGFAAHLSAALGQPIQTIAINGGGATDVREAFAKLPAARLDKVQTVVWVLSSRDLLLPEIPARRAGIEWRTVALPAAGGSSPAPDTSASPGVEELVGILRERSAIEDPAQTPYTEAVFSTVFEADDGSEHFVFFWAFRNRRPEPAASLQPGRRYRLRISPFEGNAAANRATRLDDLFRPDLAPVFAESFAPEP